MIIVSACLAGIKCRFDGSARPDEKVMELLRGKQALPCCPEALAGLKCPRPPAEIRGGDGQDVLCGRAEVYNKEGLRITNEFIKGAELFLEYVKKHNGKLVMLKSKSPSCGVHEIFDGSFAGRLRKGSGVACALLNTNNIPVLEVD